MAVVLERPTEEQLSDRIHEFQKLLNRIQSDYFSLGDNETATITLNLYTATLKTKTIKTEDGETTITRISIVCRNHNINKWQFFELADRWLKMALLKMSEFNTKTLTVTRKGNGLDTRYSFTPIDVPHKRRGVRRRKYCI